MERAPEHLRPAADSFTFCSADGKNEVGLEVAEMSNGELVFVLHLRQGRARLDFDDALEATSFSPERTP